jgi:SAM-dependent methyltransferase
MDRTCQDYLLANQAGEHARLRLQSETWEEAGRDLLAMTAAPAAARALDVGCGAMGWLRLLSRWAGPRGRVIGADIDPAMLNRAAQFTLQAGLGNVELVRDDLFDSALAPASFDLVHARFQLAPLGRADAQLAAYLRLLRPGGTLVLEEPDAATWQVHPDGSACATLVALVREAFGAGGGDFDAGRTLKARMQRHGLEPTVVGRVLTLRPGHPYLQLPLRFAESLQEPLALLAGRAGLRHLTQAAAAELAAPGAWGTTFTLVQAMAKKTDRF